MPRVICENLEGDKIEVDANQLAFRPSVYGLVIEDGRVLLSPLLDGHTFPGGAVELGERLEEALQREFLEETGLQIEPVALVDCKDSFFHLPFGGGCVHAVLVYYLCERVGGELSIEGLEDLEKGHVSLPEWIAIRDTPQIRFKSTTDCLDVLEKALRILELRQ